MNKVHAFLKNSLREYPYLKYLARLFYNNPLSGVPKLLYCAYISWRLTGEISFKKIRMPGYFIRIKIRKVRSARCTVSGALTFDSWLYAGEEPIIFTLRENSHLRVFGEMSIGHGTKILLAQNAKLLLGGKLTSSVSGITGQACIFVQKLVKIGFDSLISWGVVITDSDWHKIDGQVPIKPVIISNRVWIGHEVSILKGVHVKSGAIIAARSLISRDVQANSIVGSSKQVELKNNVHWEE